MTVVVVAVVSAVPPIALRNHTADDPVGAVAVKVMDPAPHLDCVVFTVGDAGTALMVAVADFSEDE